MEAPQQPGPVQGERIVVLDVLRGVALFGILVMNVQSYAMPSAAYVNPRAYGLEGRLDFAAWLFGYLTCDLKFISVFSMLFGAGILLSTHALEPGAERPGSFHLRRMGALFGFGILHAYLVWYGDILTAYAVCGLLVYLARHRPPEWKWRVGAGLLLVPTFIGLAAWALDAEWPSLGIGAQLQRAWGATGEVVPRELAGFRGTWAQAFATNAHLAFQQELEEFPILFAWRAAGCMLWGMALLERGVLAGTAEPATLRRLAVRGLTLGLPLVAAAAWLNEATGWQATTSYFLIGQLNALGSLGVALGWIGLIGTWVRTGPPSFLQRPLAALGRVAFTAYLSQSLICTFVFRGFGLGLFGQVGRAGLLAGAVALWLVELGLASLWLRAFAFGPLEWAWRCLSYGRVFPLRRPAR